MQLEEEPAETAPGASLDGDVDDEEVDDEEGGATGAGDLPSPFELQVGFGYATRSLSYKASQTANLNISNAGAAWMSTVRAYPAALFMGDVAGNIGLEISVETAFPGDPEANLKDETGKAMVVDFKAEASRIFFGPRARIPLGLHEVGITLGYGVHQYSVYGDENLDIAPRDGTIDPCVLNTGAAEATPTVPLPRDIPPRGSCVVPDVTYKYLRIGIDALLRFDRLLAGIRGGYRILVGAGEIEKLYWFGDTSGGAFELGVLGGYALNDMVRGLVGLDYTLYNLSFASPPPEREAGMEGGPMASGASDGYLQLWVGGAVIVPGM